MREVVLGLLRFKWPSKVIIKKKKELYYYDYDYY